jgi:hypothetical protein
MLFTLLNLGVDVLRKYDTGKIQNKSIFKICFRRSFGSISPQKTECLCLAIAKSAYKEMIATGNMRKYYKMFNSLICIAIVDGCMFRVRLLYALFRKVFLVFSSEDEEVDIDLQYSHLTLNFLSRRFFSRLVERILENSHRQSNLNFLLVTGLQKNLPYNSQFIEDRQISEKAAEFNRNTTLFHILYTIFQIQDLEDQINE